jgi:uncharacterized OsmC-like protein
LARSRIDVAGVETHVIGTLRRNERSRLRIGRLDVSIHVDAPGSDAAKLSKCLEIFEDFCVVTASVRKGLDVSVKVLDAAGRPILTSSPPLIA